jgi:hypothetical protein
MHLRDGAMAAYERGLHLDLSSQSIKVVACSIAIAGYDLVARAVVADILAEWHVYVQ